MASVSLHSLSTRFVCASVCVCALHVRVCVHTISPSDKTYDSINTIIIRSLLCLLHRIKLHSIFPLSLVALANEHLSILREVCVINDSITHHPVRSHSIHPCARSI